MSSSRNCSKSKSKNVPTKVRRRQSDAKWRASVQSCYETLKLIIPESHRANRRKLSKALILQETESHISYLEDVLTALLEEMEKQVDHGIIDPSTTPQTFQEIKQEFALKMQPPLQHIPKPKKVRNEKRSSCSSPARDTVQPYSEPDNIICTLLQGDQGDQYYYLSSQTLCLQKASPPRTNKRHLLCSTPNFQSKPYAASSLGSPINTKVHAEDSYTMSQSPCTSIPPPSSDSTRSDMVNSDMPFLMGLALHPPDRRDQKAEVFLPQLTPSKNDSDSESIPVCSPWGSAALSSIQYHPAFLTPSKVTRKLPFDIGTPSPVSMKSSPRSRPEPNSPYFGSPVTTIPGDPLFQATLGDSFMEVPSTPLLKSASEEKDDAKSLLCHESMELGDETDCQTEESVVRKKHYEEDKDLLLTPCPDHKLRPSCCPSEKELQHRPKKACVKRKKLYSEASKSDVTPAKCSTSSDKPKCCKQLEIFYDKERDELTELPVNVISVTNQCSSFDGYFYFYRQMYLALEQHLSREEMASPSTTESISQIWKDMNEDQQGTLATMAALENSNSASSSSNSLSEDLSDVSVTPISPTDLFQEFQVVPVSSVQELKKKM